MIHQTYELWFKLIIHELDWVRNVFMSEVEEEDMLRVVRQLTRIVEILKVAAGQILVLTTLTPLDFLSFRNFLGTSSGFQSVQFRVIENKLGLRRGNRIKYEAPTIPPCSGLPRHALATTPTPLFFFQGPFSLSLSLSLSLSRETDLLYHVWLTRACAALLLMLTVVLCHSTIIVVSGTKRLITLRSSRPRK